MDRAAASHGLCHPDQGRSAARGTRTGHAGISPRSWRNLRTPRSAERDCARGVTRAENCSRILGRNTHWLSAAVAQSVGVIGLVGRTSIGPAIADSIPTHSTGKTAMLARSAPSGAERLRSRRTRGLSAESSGLRPINEDGTGNNRAHPMKRSSRVRLDPTRAKCRELFG